MHLAQDFDEHIDQGHQHLIFVQLRPLSGEDQEAEITREKVSYLSLVKFR